MDDRATPVPRRSPAFDRRRVAGGLGAFLILGGLGAWAASRLDPRGAFSLQSLLDAVPGGLLALALVLVTLDFVLGGTRLHVWLRRLVPGTPWSVALKTYLVNLFAASISPMGSASGPAQLAVMARYGVAPAKGLAALLVNFIGLLSAFVLIGGASGTYLLASARLPGTAGGVVRALLLVVTATTVLVVVIVGNPRAGAGLARRLLAMGNGGGGRLSRGLVRLGGMMERGVADYEAALAALRSGWYRPLTVATALSALMLLNKCAVGYLLAVGMGYDGSYVEVAARQSLQWLLIYFSPSPGGSGIAEATVPAFLGGIIPAGRIVEYTILWRGVTALFGAIVGGVVAASVLGGLRRDSAT
jgi:uncharacterized protein (TIRG00374 family)